jgi:hypothetical protein
MMWASDGDMLWQVFEVGSVSWFPLTRFRTPIL